jgi:hypothetical protein
VLEPQDKNKQRRQGKGACLDLTVDCTVSGGDKLPDPKARATRRRCPQKQNDGPPRGRCRWVSTGAPHTSEAKKMTGPPQTKHIYVRWHCLPKGTATATATGPLPQIRIGTGVGVVRCLGTRRIAARQGQGPKQMAYMAYGRQ